jgi:RNA polymerase sigma-32 factor
VPEVSIVSGNQAEWAEYRHAARTKPLLAAHEERTMLELAKAGNRCATAALVESHMRLVVQVASSYARDGLSVHDLVSEGMLGLMEAIHRFDLTRDARFATYASWWVRACVRQHALANRRIVSMPDSRGARVARARLRKVERGLAQSLGRTPTHAELARELGVSEREVEAVDVALSGRDQSIGLDAEPLDEAQGPEQTLAARELSALRHVEVKRALEQLSERERRVVCEHICAEDEHSLAHLGRTLGVSRQRAGQILRGAEEKLRAELSTVA